MKQMSIRLPDDLMDWLNIEAKLNFRSKNLHVVKLLEQARNIPQVTDTYITGSTQLCNVKHHWLKPNPDTSEYCNCGHYVYGEVVR